jgi:hypothetical protein
MLFSALSLMPSVTKATRYVPEQAIVQVVENDF